LQYLLNLGGGKNARNGRERVNLKLDWLLVYEEECGGDDCGAASDQADEFREKRMA
jgi:hypothetical protein